LAGAGLDVFAVGAAAGVGGDCASVMAGHENASRLIMKMARMFGISR
jgi:hypothetical protein